MFIESSDFLFIDCESNVSRREFKSLTVKITLKILFFGDLVSNISFLVDGEGVMEIVEFKFKHNYPLPSDLFLLKVGLWCSFLRIGLGLVFLGKFCYNPGRECYSRYGYSPWLCYDCYALTV